MLLTVTCDGRCFRTDRKRVVDLTEPSGLLQLASRDLDEIIAIRHDLHMHPELGNEEERTSAVVAEKLASWGISDVTRMAGTGLVATIRGRRTGDRSIGLRADMDALAINELNSFGHVSRYPGRMHACGHDGHTSMLLAAARLLAADPDFAGTVHLIFQPAEEGRGGALKMLAEGLFEKFPCDRIYGMHSAPHLPVGEFGTMTGAMMAAAGRWTTVFRGDGGHGGAGPHLTQDLSVVAATFINALQAVVARNVSAFDPAIISIGHIQGGSAESLNVLPSELHLGGTMRAFSDDIQKLITERIAETARMSADMYGASSESDSWWGSVPVVTDEAATRSALEAAAQVVGSGSVDPAIAATTAGEDFSFMLQKRPGNFIWLGNDSHDGDGGGQLHTPYYDFNDRALPFGIAYWLSVVNVELDGRYGG